MAASFVLLKEQQNAFPPASYNCTNEQGADQGNYFWREDLKSFQGLHPKVFQGYRSTSQGPALSVKRAFQGMGKVTRHMEGLDGLHGFAAPATFGESKASNRRTFQELLCTLGEYINGVSSRRHAHHKSRLAAALQTCTHSRFDDHAMETDFEEQTDALLASPPPQTPGKRSPSVFLSQVSAWDLSPGPSSRYILWNSPRDMPAASNPLTPTSPNAPNTPRHSLFKSAVNVDYRFDAENVRIEGGLVSPGQYVASQFKGLNIGLGQRKRFRHV